MGRPTKYKKEFNKYGYELALLGATDNQIAEALDINVDTLNQWKEIHAGFSVSLRRGKIKADSLVAAAMFKRALGFTYNEITFEKIDGKVNLEVTTDEMITTDAYRKKIVTKTVIPDVGAQTLWLKNRQKEIWRESYAIDSKIISDLNDESLNKLYTQVMAGINELSKNPQTDDNG